MTSFPNMPDEFVEGFFKAGQSLMQAFGAAPNGAAAPTADKAASSLANLQARYFQDQMRLWMSAWTAATGQSKDPVVSTDRGDRRFHAEEWRSNAWYSMLKQAYLLNARFLDEIVEASDLDAKTRHKLRFFTRQFIDSMSPANFAATNPDAIKLAYESQGESVKAGLANLLEDMKRGRISITDETAFEVGRNVATSEGAVVFENALFQLIQYAPLTKEVAQRPLVIVPPCINKFYILDLQPENSFVRFASEQGQTVFLVSWCNPGQDLGNTTWDDYIEDGAMKAIEVAKAISRADKVNAVGWCVGGTILSSALAVLRARGDESVSTLTLLTTMLDFQEPGDLGVFIDEQGVTKREQEIGKGGIYPGSELGFVFQTLRANDLIWPYVVSNYLKGKVARCVRPSLLELRWHQSAGADVCLVLAQHVPREQPVRAGETDDVRHRCRPQQDRHPQLCAGHPGRPHRALEVGLPKHPAPGRQVAVRARRQRSHCGSHQSGIEEQAQLLDRRCVDR